jgi:hypothetical protein
VLEDGSDLDIFGYIGCRAVVRQCKAQKAHGQKEGGIVISREKEKQAGSTMQRARAGWQEGALMVEDQLGQRSVYRKFKWHPSIAKIKAQSHKNVNIRKVEETRPKASIAKSEDRSLVIYLSSKYQLFVRRLIHSPNHILQPTDDPLYSITPLFHFSSAPELTPEVEKLCQTHLLQPPRRQQPQPRHQLPLRWAASWSWCAWRQVS